VIGFEFLGYLNYGPSYGPKREAPKWGQNENSRIKLKFRIAVALYGYYAPAKYLKKISIRELIKNGKLRKF
jgi:hypothetical protein